MSDMHRSKMIEEVAAEMWDLVKQDAHGGIYRSNDWRWCVDNLPLAADNFRNRAAAALSRCESVQEEKTLDLRLKEALIRGTA